MGGFDWFSVRIFAIQLSVVMWASNFSCSMDTHTALTSISYTGMGSLFTADRLNFMLVLKFNLEECQPKCATGGREGEREGRSKEKTVLCRTEGMSAKGRCKLRGS